MNYVNNEAPDSVSPEFRTDLEWIKRLRNEIEHHKFTMDVAQVRTTIGRPFRSVTELLEKESDIALETHIPKLTKDTFEVLTDE